MNGDKQREEMNSKLDVLFEQIEKLDVAGQQSATWALNLWGSAKTCEFLGLGPMEARSEYKMAYNQLRDMGLEVGGMIEPYESAKGTCNAEGATRNKVSNVEVTDTP